MKTFAKLLVLRLLLAALSPGLAAAGKPAAKNQQPDIPVTVYFRDALGDRIGSDGAGVYAHGVDGVNALILGSNGNLRFGTRNSSRSVVLDLSDPANSPACANPDSIEPCLKDFTFVNVGMEVKQTVLDATTQLEAAMGDILEGGLLAIPIGEFRLARMGFIFPDPRGFDWQLRFRPETFPDTSAVVVLRVNENTWPNSSIFPSRSTSSREVTRTASISLPREPCPWPSSLRRPLTLSRWIHSP